MSENRTVDIPIKVGQMTNGDNIYANVHIDITGGSTKAEIKGFVAVDFRSKEYEVIPKWVPKRK
ncbi:MAG TPA: hypothetical protein VIH03_03750 [Nitrososphaerales archaeon]